MIMMREDKRRASGCAVYSTFLYKPRSRTGTSFVHDGPGASSVRRTLHDRLLLCPGAAQSPRFHGNKSRTRSHPIIPSHPKSSPSLSALPEYATARRPARDGLETGAASTSRPRQARLFLSRRTDEDDDERSGPGPWKCYREELWTRLSESRDDKWSRSRAKGGGRRPGCSR